MKSQYFQKLVEGHAHFMRHNRTPESAGDVLDYIITNLAPVTTQIQTEMGEEGKPLVDTAAGSVQQEEIERLIAQHKKEVSALQEDINSIRESNAAARRELEEERAELQAKLARWEAECVELKEGLERESSARQKLEADMVAEREGRDKWREEQERKFGTPGRAEEKRRHEERIREEVSHAIHARRHRSFRKKGMDLGEDIPLLPTFIAKPAFGVIGFGLDILKAVRDIPRSKK